MVKGGAIATNLVELWHSPPDKFWVVRLSVHAEVRTDELPIS
ncbi:MAG: hypothetical protein RID53_15825 [Coleofasciculus sp. B1-GNL1-01]